MLNAPRSKKRKVPARPCGRAGTNRGMGVRQALFPAPTLGAHPRGGCRLPDAILHGKRSHRPRSRAVQRLAAAEFRVRLFSSLGLVVAPPTREPGQDTSAISFSRLDRFDTGRPLLLTARWPAPRVSPLASQAAFRSQASGVVFNIAGFRKVFTGPAESSCPSRNLRSLCFTFRWLSLGGFKRLIEPARVARPVLIHSSNRIPSG